MVRIFSDPFASQFSLISTSTQLFHISSILLSSFFFLLFSLSSILPFFPSFLFSHIFTYSTSILTNMNMLIRFSGLPSAPPGVLMPSIDTTAVIRMARSQSYNEVSVMLISYFVLYLLVLSGICMHYIIIFLSFFISYVHVY